MGVKFLTRSVMSGPHLALVCSQKEYQRAMKRAGLPKADAGEWLSDDQLGRVTTVKNSSLGGLVCVVSLRLIDDSASMTETLVHEAVHVKQDWFEFMGEHSPGRETEAVIVESVFDTLHRELARRTQK